MPETVGPMAGSSGPPSTGQRSRMCPDRTRSALKAVTEFAEAIDQTSRRMKDVLLAATDSLQAELVASTT